MKKQILLIVTISWIAPYLFSAPPGFNPNLSIEEHRRQQEILRRQNQKIAEQNLENKIEEDSKIFIKARIFDLFSDEPVNGTVSYLFLKTGREREFRKGKQEYTTTIPKFSDTRIIFRAKNYFDNAVMYSREELAPLEQLVLDTKLIRRGANGIGEAIEIFFDGDSHILKEEYFNSLDIVASTIRADKGLSVLVNGYSGREGGETSAGLQMSVKRAEVVKEYLIKKGLDRNIINAVGMGMTDDSRDKKYDYRAEVYILEE